MSKQSPGIRLICKLTPRRTRYYPMRFTGMSEALDECQRLGWPPGLHALIDGERDARPLVRSLRF